jgi:hypothetical protein
MRLRTDFAGETLLLPTSLGGLTCQLLGLPITAAEEIDEARPLVAVVALPESGADDARSLEVAVAVRARDGSRLRARLTLGRDAPFEVEPDAGLPVVRLRRRSEGAFSPRLADVPLGVLDDHLIAAGSPRALERLGPYLVRGLGARASRGAPESFPAGAHSAGERAGTAVVSIELSAGALSGPFRRALGDAFAGMVGSWPAPLPALLDPSGLGEALAALGEVGGVSAELRFDERVVLLAADARWADGAAGRAVAAPARRRGADLLAVPDDTALVVAWAESDAGRRARASEAASALSSFVGEPAGAADVFAALAEARGAQAIAGIRCSGAGPTGYALGEIHDADGARRALGTLAEILESGAARRRLAEHALTVKIKKTRVARVPVDLFRARLRPRTGGGKPDDTALPVDWLTGVSGERFFVTAGYEAAETLERLYAPTRERSLAGVEPLSRAIEEASGETWLFVVADPERAAACLTGSPGGPSTPVVLAVGPSERGARLRFEMDAALLRQLGRRWLR